MYHQIAIFVLVDLGIMISLYCLKSLLLKDGVEDIATTVGDRP